MQAELEMNGLVQPISFSMPMPVNMERFTAFRASQNVDAFVLLDSKLLVW
jgi:hypothetical protein